MEEVHEALGEAFPWVVLTHVGLILVTRLTRGRSLATPMLTGRADGAGPDPARRNHAWLAVLLLAGVLSYWAWEWGQPPAQRLSSLLTVSAISLPG